MKRTSVCVCAFGALCIRLPRIKKYPSNMKIAYMQQEADLDNTKTASEDRLQLPVLLCLMWQQVVNQDHPVKDIVSAV